MNGNGEVVGTSSTGIGWYWKSGVGSIAISPPPGTAATGPRRINANGTVVGVASGYVFVWKNGTAAQKLNLISQDAPAMGMALNDSNQVISTYDVPAGSFTLPHGCVFEKNSAGAWVTTPQDLAPLPGDNASQAHALNNNGLVVGVSFVLTRDADGFATYGPMRLAAWQKDPTGTWQGSAIPDTVTGATRYSVTNVNSSGEAAGNCSGGTIPTTDGFFVDTVTYEMTPIRSPSGETSKVHGLNDSGQMCGWSDFAAGVRRAVYWDKSRGPNNWLYLGTLGGDHSRAAGGTVDLEEFRSINSAGYVVGFSYTSGNRAVHGFVWDAARGMRDLNAITPNKAGFQELGSAWAISDAGQISGIGTSKGKQMAYLLTPQP